MLNFEQINILGNILNTPYGQGLSYNCTATMQGELLLIMYSTFANLASEQAMSSQIPRISVESTERMAALIKMVKAKFKEKAGTSLKLTEELNNDSVEVVQSTPLNPRRVILYRRKAVFKVG